MKVDAWKQSCYIAGSFIEVLIIDTQEQFIGNSTKHVELGKLCFR